MITAKAAPPFSNFLQDYHLLAYDELDSTNEEAKRLAYGGAAHGAVIWAKRQSAGKGRMGRSWVSQQGNLFVSLLLKPECALAEAAQLSFVTAVAAQEAIAPLLSEPEQLTCKWPNDLLYQGRKLGGILLESFQGSDGEIWMIVGIGINIDSFPSETNLPATSLREAGVEIISAKIVLSRLIHHFTAEYDRWKKKGFVPIRRSWKRHAWGVGQTVHVALPNETVEGIFADIAADGALLLTLPGRKRRTVYAGDVFPTTQPERKAR